MAAVSPSEEGAEALHRLKSIDPPLWLNPSPDLSQTARKVSQHLFSSLKPFCPKSYLDTLLVQGFDAEQIWQQIELQTQPLISILRRDVKRVEKNSDGISSYFGGKLLKKAREEKREIGEMETEGLDEDTEEDDDMDEEESDEELEEEEEDGEEGEEEEEEEGDGGIEDRFLKMNELEEYMEADEAREYGGSQKKASGPKDADEEEDDDEDDEDEEIGGFGADGNEDEGVDDLGRARYEDFFGGKKRKGSKRESKPPNGLEDDDQEDDEGFHSQSKEPLSTHEKELEKLRSKAEQMEKANLEPKSWIMQGEVTAAKRPKNSALEVDLDFEHNVRPLPVITEEVTASLEELIKKRILEGTFDDPQKVSGLPSKAPKEIKELDDNKSKKGLAEIYEDEYAQQTGLGGGPVSSSDELKKEAQLLFGKLCLKLDALSHFHFKPKPVIEDMSVQTNVPALAMEEIAPVAVSDAAMLAPEEVFAGKGDIKEETELSQAERKRRRASKKRKFKAKASKRVEKKAPDSTLLNGPNGKLLS